MASPDDESWDGGTAIGGATYSEVIAQSNPDFEDEVGTAVAGQDYVENIRATVETPVVTPPSPAAAAPARASSLQPAATASGGTSSQKRESETKPSGLGVVRSPTKAFGTPVLLRAPATAGAPAEPEQKMPMPTRNTAALHSLDPGARTPMPVRAPTPAPAARAPTPAPARDSAPVIARQPTPAPARDSAPVIARQPTPAPARDSAPVIARQPTPAPARASSPVIARQPTPAPARTPTPAPVRPTPVPGRPGSGPVRAPAPSPSVHDTFSEPATAAARPRYIDHSPAEDADAAPEPVMDQPYARDSSSPVSLSALAGSDDRDSVPTPIGEDPDDDDGSFHDADGGDFPTNVQPNALPWSNTPAHSSVPAPLRPIGHRSTPVHGARPSSPALDRTDVQPGSGPVVAPDRTEVLPGHGSGPIDRTEQLPGFIPPALRSSARAATPGGTQQHAAPPAPRERTPTPAPQSIGDPARAPSVPPERASNPLLGAEPPPQRPPAPLHRPTPAPFPVANSPTPQPLTTPASVSAEPPVASEPARRSRKGLWLALGFVVIALGAGGAVLYMQMNADEGPVPITQAAEEARARNAGGSSDTTPTGSATPQPAATGSGSATSEPAASPPTGSGSAAEPSGSGSAASPPSGSGSAAELTGSGSAAEPSGSGSAATEPAKVEPAEVEPAKVEPAKVDPAKVAPGKATPVKKPPVKKPPAKRPPVRRPPPKKAPAKKPAAPAAPCTGLDCL